MLRRATAIAERQASEQEEASWPTGPGPLEKSRDKSELFVCLEGGNAVQFFPVLSG